MNPLLFLIPGGLIAFLLSKKGGGDVLTYTVGSDAEVNALFSALPPQGQRYLSQVLQVAQEEGVSPFLLFAIMSRESNYGLALSSNMTGDAGHGRGLMQIDDRSDTAWLNANPWKDAYTNIKRGAQILNMKLAYFLLGGNGTVTVPDSYASRLGTSGGDYQDPRPLSGDMLARAGVAAYNSGQGAVLYALAAGYDPDSFTAGGNYGADVLAREAALRDEYKNLV